MKRVSKHTFELRSAVLDNRFSVPLEVEDFDTLRAARDFLLVYMSFEESVLQILFAAQAFEEYLLREALDHYLFPNHEFDYFQNTRLRANLYVTGVLNSITSLRDQFPKFKGLTGDLNARSFFLERWDGLKVNSVTFRFGERLRNYAQHQSQPVDGATTGGAWDKGRELMESHLSVYTHLANVLTNRSITKIEADEYRETFGKDVDLALVLREMLGCIGTLVGESRVELAPFYDTAVSTYAAHLKSIEVHVKGLVIANAAYSIDGKIIEKFNIFGDFLERASTLRSNLLMTNNHEHFISNRARGHVTD